MPPKKNNRKQQKQRAFEMKYRGATYEQIANEISYSKHTLGHYFSEKWKDEFESYCKMLNKARDDEAIQILRANVADTVRQLINELGNSNPNVRMKAIKEILDRKWGKPKETVEQENTYDLDWGEIADVIQKNVKQGDQKSGSGDGDRESDS